MSQVLNIRIKDKTLEETDRLRKRFDAPSRSDVIRRAIELSDALSSAVAHGEKIIIEGKDGRREVFLPGIKHGR